MTYADQLKDPQWEKKRKLIIDRDNHTCKHCGIKPISEGFNPDLPDAVTDLHTFLTTYKCTIISVNSDGIIIICENEKYLNKDNSGYRYLEWDSLMTDFVVNTNPNRKPYLSWCFRNEIYFPFEPVRYSGLEEMLEMKKVTNRLFFEALLRIEYSEGFDLGMGYTKIGLGLFPLPLNEGKKSSLNFEPDRILKVFNPDLIEKYKQNSLKVNLQVHHHYYVYGRRPWMYDDSALVTLCNICHHRTHQNNKIPIYNSMMQLIDHAENCPRCNGSGFLPQYDYFMNGICFQCLGDGVIIKEDL